jgi:hypothetical protein
MFDPMGDKTPCHALERTRSGALVGDAGTEEWPRQRRLPRCPPASCLLR